MKVQSVQFFILSLVLTASVLWADTFGTGENQFTIDFVHISADTNPGDGYYVPNNYRMGVYEITVGQWNKFEAEYGTPTGTPDYAYDESPYWTSENQPLEGNPNAPVENVSWYEAAQFVNWLNISTGHHPAYKFSASPETRLESWSSTQAWNGGGWVNRYRHKDAFYFLPAYDEWVKAAYWNGNYMQTYATPDDTVPVVDVEANYFDTENSAYPFTWEVGTGAIELNGTYDMMGNVKEWIESPYYIGPFGDYQPDDPRDVRGGGYSDSGLWALSSDGKLVGEPYVEMENLGFRVASVPEPSTLVLMGIGLASFAKRKK